MRVLFLYCLFATSYQVNKHILICSYTDVLSNTFMIELFRYYDLVKDTKILNNQTKQAELSVWCLISMP